MFCYLFCFGSHYRHFDGIDAELCCVVSVSPSTYNANIVVTSTIHIFIPFFLLLLTHLICFVFCSVWQTYCALLQQNVSVVVGFLFLVLLSICSLQYILFLSVYVYTTNLYISFLM